MEEEDDEPVSNQRIQQMFSDEPDFKIEGQND